MSLPTPSYGTSTIRSVDVITSPSDMPYHRRRRGLAYRHWRVVYEPGQINPTQQAAILALWETKQRGESFAWTPPNESSSRLVMFDREQDSLNVDVFTSRAVAMVLQLREVDPV